MNKNFDTNTNRHVLTIQAKKKRNKAGKKKIKPVNNDNNDLNNGATSGQQQKNVNKLIGDNLMQKSKSKHIEASNSSSNETIADRGDGGYTGKGDVKNMLKNKFSYSKCVILNTSLFDKNYSSRL